MTIAKITRADRRATLLTGAMLLVALGCAPLGFSSLPKPYNEPERWLIAATGQCTHQTYIQEDTPITRQPEFEGDGFTTAIANVTFEFVPSASIKFTDAPYHRATEIGSSRKQVEELQSSAWMKKNIALMEPAGDDWAISVYKVEENGKCANRTDCVHCGLTADRTRDLLPAPCPLPLN